MRIMNNKHLNDAVQILNSGGLVAFPTETVYGLGADASNPVAVEKIFAAKERPHNHPLIVHLATIDEVTNWARDFPETAQRLSAAFWPGPLTMILAKQPQVSDVVTGKQATIGLRMPQHPVAQALLKAFGRGIAAPSANKFTRISPTTATAVREELGDAVDLILDGGDCTVGLESTIVDLSQGLPVILRPGMISAAAIADVLEMDVVASQHQPMMTRPRAPGMHHLHYAPNTRTHLVAADEVAPLLQQMDADQYPIALILCSDHSLIVHPQCHIVRLSTDPTLYARELYRTLRELDQQGFKQLLIEAPPATAGWDAIRDRVLKATAPRR